MSATTTNHHFRDETDKPVIRLEDTAIWIDMDGNFRTTMFASAGYFRALAEKCIEAANMIEAAE